MSQENVEIVRQLLGAEPRREAAALAAAVYDPHVVMTFSDSPFADFADPMICHGLDEVRAAFGDFYASFENVGANVHELIDAGEHVVAVFTYAGWGRTSGVKTEWRDMAGVWSFRAGKVIRVDWLRSREDALEATGLS